MAADGDTVKMRLTFPRGKQQPGEIVDVPADEVHRWKGFAVPADGAEKTAEKAPPKTTTEPKPAAK
ncbi:hypothetical protein [Streptomyces sp. NPDC005953]|uniref:hypothetical protein n=1 Tax=Streptomyces sp. NPDC005953 TaxID=3156719 RepID=UPI0034109556